MKKKIRRIKSLVLVGIITLGLLATERLYGQRNMEYLTRGLVAVKTTDHVFLSWRIFATDTTLVEFNLYRNGSLVNQAAISGKSNFSDPDGSLESIYLLETITAGKDTSHSAPVSVWQQNYLTVPLKTPPGYTPNDASVADLDGDGEMEIVVKMEGATHDNAHAGDTDPVYLHAYKMNGILLWSINLGINIRGGAHYTQFMVYDLDSDGRAEVACKTAPGTKDGLGNFLKDGPAAGDDDEANYRNSSGYILNGPEYLTVFDGLSGQELSTVDYIPLRADPYPLSTWGDGYGNRVDRFLACVAYFESIPSLVMCRGYYDRTTLTAWDFRDQQLVQRWAFDTQEDPSMLRQYEGQGNHGIAVGDVDLDGKDEIMYGAMAFDDDGSPLYNTRLGHGDASHLTDLIPDRPGQEFYMPHESANGGSIPGISVRDAATGEIIWSKPANGDIGRALTADITADHPGNEFWASSGLGVYNSSGANISSSRPSVNFASWWDGDLLREVLDGITISKWGQGSMLVASGCLSNNGTKATPAFSGDILGDWREEVIWRTNNNQALRVYTTTFPSQYGIYTLLQDPQYRQALAWQNVAYNQPPHPAFFLGHEMEQPPIPHIKVADPSSTPVIQILSPGNGEVLNRGLDLNVIVHAAGLSDTSKMVWLYDNDTILLDTLFAPPYISAITGGLETGSHTLRASGYNQDGEHFYSLPVSFMVDEGYPHVLITSPENKAIYSPGEDISLNADAWDTDGNIDSVTFFVDGIRLASLTESPYAIQWENPELGTYEIRAIAYDDFQNATASDSVLIEVGAILIVQENTPAFCGFFQGGGSIDNNHVGHTGDGFANSDNIAGVQIVWAVQIPEAGDYTFTWRYACEQARPGRLYINDTLIGTVDFENTGAWTAWEDVSLNADGLNAGKKKITLEATDGNGLANIDYLKILSLSTDQSAESAACTDLPLGMNEFRGYYTGDSQFILYPVPASRELTVYFPDPSVRIDQLCIYRLDGRRILDMTQVNENQVCVNIQRLESAIYVVQVRTDRGTFTRKFNVLK